MGLINGPSCFCGGGAGHAGFWMFDVWERSTCRFHANRWQFISRTAAQCHWLADALHVGVVLVEVLRRWSGRS